jgi:hypothetical protein
MLTIEEVLVVGLVVQIPAVLLDGVDAELGRVNRLDAEIEVIQASINLAVVVAAGVLHPQLLHLLAFDDMIPVVAATVGLRLGEPSGVVEGPLGDEQPDFVPQSLGLRVHALEGLLEGLMGACECLGEWPHGIVSAIDAARQHMLSLLLEAGRRSSRRSAQKDGRGGDPHGSAEMKPGANG